MKNLITFLLIFLISLQSFAKDEEKLPEIPWANIAEMNLTPNIESMNWKSDIYVKLQGFYSKEDSIIVSKAIEQLDSITETISIQYTDKHRGNFEIFVMDTLWHLNSDYYISSTSHPNSLVANLNSRSTSSNDSGRIYTQLFVIRGSTQNWSAVLKNKIAASLVAGGLKYDEGQQITKNRNSIFNPLMDTKNGIVAHQEELNDLDIAIIRETYKEGYQKRLELAKQQFKPKIIAKFWWEKISPSSLLLFPFGVILIILTFLYFKLSKRVLNKVRNQFLVLNIKILVVLIVLAFLYVLYIFSVDYWPKYEINDESLLNYWRMFQKIMGVPLIIMLFGANLIIFFEKIIKKYTNSLAIKLIFIFTTSLLFPQIILYVFTLLVIKITNGSYPVEDQFYQAVAIIFTFFFVVASFRVLISYFSTKEKELIIENETKLSTLRELKSKAELNALHSRINPHFLYNSLNSIAGLAHENADKTEHMALSLSKLFRYSINKEKSDWTTFEEELEMVRIYLDVEKVRFGDRLDYSVEIPKELEKQKIPRFIIQPLVENAVKHGISNAVDGGEIKVIIAKNQKDITVSVSDSGPSFPNDLTPGFGIQSIYDKLEILYPDKFELTFSNSPQKQVTIKLK